MSITLTCALLCGALVSPLTAADPAPSLDDEVASVHWYDGGYNRALREARDNEQLVFIALVPNWSDYSNQLVEETFPSEPVANELSELVCLKYDLEDHHFAQIVKRYNVEVFPSIVVAQPNGNIEEIIEGFIPVDPLVDQMRRIKSSDNTVSGWEHAVESDPENLDVQLELAMKLEACRDWRNYERVVRSIREADPHGESPAGVRLDMKEIWTEIAANTPAGETYDLAPMYAYMPGVTAPEAAFAGWSRIANLHASMGQVHESVSGFQRCYEVIDQGDLLNWGNDVVNYMLERNDETPMNDDERRFALELAKAAVQRAVDLGDPEAEHYGLSFNGDDYDNWLASRLDLLTWAHLAFDDEQAGAQQALSVAQRCVELDPENPEYQGRLEMVKARL